MDKFDNIDQMQHVLYGYNVNMNLAEQIDHDHEQDPDLESVNNDFLLSAKISISPLSQSPNTSPSLQPLQDTKTQTRNLLHWV